MEGKLLVVAKIVTLAVALVGVCVLIYGWFSDRHDAPVILSGILTGLIFAILGFNKAKAEPDPERDNVIEVKKDDDISDKKEELNGTS